MKNIFYALITVMVLLTTCVQAEITSLNQVITVFQELDSLLENNELNHSYESVIQDR
jgi:hypothetical protein